MANNNAAPTNLNNNKAAPANKANNKAAPANPNNNKAAPANPNNKANNKAKNKANNKKVETDIIELEGSEYDIGSIIQEKFLTNPTTRVVLIAMISLIFFFGAIILLYHYSTGRKVQTLYNKILPLFNQETFLIPSSNMKPSFNNKQTYILYINFENSSGSDIWYHSFHENKMILRRIDDNFMVKYNPASNKLVVNIRIKKLDIQQINSDLEDGSLASTAEDNLGLHNSYEYIYLNNIPHHKWLQIAIMIDNRLVDIYVDSKLAVSRVIENVPVISNETIMLGQEYHNPHAYVGRLEYTNDTLSTLDLKSLYFKNMRYLKIDSVLRETVVMDSLEIRKNLNPSPSL